MSFSSVAFVFFLHCFSYKNNDLFPSSSALSLFLPIYFLLILSFSFFFLASLLFPLYSSFSLFYQSPNTIVLNLLFFFHISFPFWFLCFTFLPLEFNFFFLFDEFPSAIFSHLNTTYFTSSMFCLFFSFSPLFFIPSVLFTSTSTLLFRTFAHFSCPSAIDKASTHVCSIIVTMTVDTINLQDDDCCFLLKEFGSLWSLILMLVSGVVTSCFIIRLAFHSSLRQWYSLRWEVELYNSQLHWNENKKNIFTWLISKSGLFSLDDFRRSNSTRLWKKITILFGKEWMNTMQLIA